MVKSGKCGKFKKANGVWLTISVLEVKRFGELKKESIRTTKAIKKAPQRDRPHKRNNKEFKNLYYIMRQA